MNENEKDRLKGLFQEMNLNDPAAGFESRLMEKIHIASAKKERKRLFLNILAIAGGIIGVLGIPLLFFWQMGLLPTQDIGGEALTVKIPYIYIDPMLSTIGCVALLLLIADMLIRKRIWEKKHKEE